MTPETVVQDATRDGVTLSLTALGTIKLNGEKTAVAKWTPTIRDHKAELVELLAANDADTLPDSDMERRRQAVLKMLRENPEITRATVADGDLDPVHVAIAVRGVGSCELIISTDKWDPLQFAALLDQEEGAA